MFFDSTGVLKEEVLYDNGVREGLTTLFSSSGNQKSKLNYKNAWKLYASVLLHSGRLGWAQYSQCLCNPQISSWYYLVGYRWSLSSKRQGAA